MSGSNQETLRSYQARVQHYIDGTASEVAGASRDWIDGALSGLPAQARLVELGSAFGRDAAYIRARGFELECTGAVPGFVAALQARGFDARLCNVLANELAEGYDLILANAVLLHFNRGEFASVAEKMRRALVSGGRFAFSLKSGQGEAWSSEKIGAPRFFCYWEPDELAAALREAGFVRWTIDEAYTSRAHADWLYVTAFTP